MSQPASRSLWSTLEKKTQPKKPKKATKAANVIAVKPAFNLFSLLDERAGLEDDRPCAIDYAVVEKIVEETTLKKLAGVTIKRNPLNQTFFVVKNPQTHQYFRLDEKEKFLWDKMDGDHTMQDLAIEYFTKFGKFAYDNIIELVFDLKKKTLLEQQYVNIYEDLSVWKKSKELLHVVLHRLKQAIEVEFPIKNSDQFFAKIHDQFFSFFFRKSVLKFLLFLSFLGATSFLWQVFFHTPTLFSGKGLVIEVGTLLFLTALSLCLHEIAHGVATKHFKREVPKAGFLLYFFWPAFFVDTTDMWMEEKEKRIAVSLAGPATDFILAAVASLIAFFSQGSFGGEIAFKFALASYVSVFINMNPLVEWDGYFIFMDVLGIPCLRKRSLHFIRYDLLKKITTHERFSREDIMFSVFGLLSFTWSVIAIVAALHFWETQLRHLF